MVHVFMFLFSFLDCGGGFVRDNRALQFRRPCRQMVVDPQMDLRKVVRNLRLKLCARTVPGPSLVGSWGDFSPPTPPLKFMGQKKEQKQTIYCCQLPRNQSSNKDFIFCVRLLRIRSLHYPEFMGDFSGFGIEKRHHKENREL